MEAMWELSDFPLQGKPARRLVAFSAFELMQQRLDRFLLGLYEFFRQLAHAILVAYRLAMQAHVQASGPEVLHLRPCREDGVIKRLIASPDHPLCPADDRG
ncbi:hypothetical protein AB0F52_48450 [Amycolatopsis sp. NPDC024027]|uniref:hypothetical protein n=1 Tax=Amycolatopsis sp. NPDC024027 TaxID=3154327 RepID=UPI00340A5C20